MEGDPATSEDQRLKPRRAMQTAGKVGGGLAADANSRRQCQSSTTMPVLDDNRAAFRTSREAIHIHEVQHLH
jgi:hypothetical protein